MADFRGYVTAAGQTFEALAKQMGYPVTIGFIEVGDGKLPDSESPIDRTQLVHKLKQFPAIVEQDAKNPGQWVATCYIPADDAINGAGYFIREIGCKLINQGNGVLYAYRRVSDDWKPVITSGEAKSFIYKLRFIPSNGELLTPTIDPSVVLVDKEELARVMKTHEDTMLSDIGASLLGVGRGRNQADKNAEFISVKDFDKAAGIYGYLCHNSIEEADQWCYERGKTLWFPDGQYCIGKSVVKKARWKASGAPELAPFPQNDDDKIYLRPGHKSKLPGASIILMKGAVLSSVNTIRSDMFSSMTYAVKTLPRYPANIDGIAIVMDMDVYDADGVLTTPSTDNRAECDVGFLVDDSSASDFPNLTVFGYWNKAGTVIWSHGIGDNPDYTKFGFGSTMGYFGLALIGNDSAAGPGPGLSGTQGFGFQLFANDHHSREPQPLRPGQTHPYGHAIFIDGDTGAIDADVNGHEFVGGGIRTYSNRPLVVDNCSNLHLVNVPFEFSSIDGRQDTLGHKFIGTDNTRNVRVIGCRNAPYTLFDHADFGGVVSRLTWDDPTQGNTVIGEKGAYLYLSPKGSAGGPRVNFTRSPGSTVTGTSIVMDTFDGDKLKIKSGSYTVASISGETLEISKARAQMMSFSRVARTLTNDTLVVPTEVTYVQVAGENGVADNLVSIQGNPVIGQILVLRQASSSMPITIKRTGNIRFYDDTDRVLDNIFKQISLMWDGSFWILLSI
ncbi:phage tail protein [Aeromonas dhakensis]|uniref:phage tail protein n=1 Tax=Aeromonas dhakensis TaxID=196024 RepID=UPI0038D0CFAE